LRLFRGSLAGILIPIDRSGEAGALNKILADVFG
jgi:hypothetical protein